MYYYTCKAVLTYILHKFYQTQPNRPGINANGQIILDSTDLTGNQCKCTNSTRLDRFDQASMQMDKLYHT